jgi:ParB-like chromosome segregation protein Spo0J
VARLSYNPGSHRVRAQLSHDAAREADLVKDPWGDESQEYLEYLIKAVPADPSKPDPAFDALMESLEKDKQNEPGLITRDGILVNGNTRRAALKQLGVTSIRVGVLPESTTWADIHSIELALQLRPDRRREYSYINHLLAVEEQIGQSIPPAAVARNFRTTTPSIERDLWILNQIRDLIRRSQNSGHALRLVDFENAKERFFELYRAYSKEVAKNKEKADLLRENRLAAIVLEFSKTDVRHIEPEFQERYLDPRLPEDQRSESSAQTVGVAIPGLGRAVKPTGTRVVAARELTDAILKAKAVRVKGDRVSPAQFSEANQAFRSLQQIFDEALGFAGKDHSLRKKRQAAPDRVDDAAKALEQCITDVVLARGNNSLDENALDESLLNLRSVLGRLSAEAAKSIALPDAGVRWLHTAAESE